MLNKALGEGGFREFDLLYGTTKMGRILTAHWGSEALVV